MRRIGVLALCFLAAACGKKKDEKEANVDLSELQAKYDDYMTWSNELTQERGGWVTDGCDDTLKTGLRGTYDERIDLTLALRSPGEWTRRRISLGDCYELRGETGERLSKSRTSRDMALGAAAWMLTHKRTDLAKDVLDYVDHHGGLLGDGDESRTRISPPLYATYLKIAGRKQIEESIPVAVGGEIGFERHLSAWHLLIRADAEGGMREGYNGWIKDAADLQPQNPLFQYMKAAFVTGDFAPFLAAAMDERYFPRDHLPTSEQVCDDWVIQRDMGKDWAPCLNDDGTPAPFKQYTGSDWLAVVHRVLKRSSL